MSDQELANFVAVTGADETTAKHFLEAHGGSLELAVQTYLETGGDLGSTGNGGAASGLKRGAEGALAAGGGGAFLPPGGAAGGGGEDAIRAPDQVKRGRLIEGPLGAATHTEALLAAQAHAAAGRRAAARDPFRNYGEEGRSLLAGAAATSNDPHARKLANLFAPPHELMFHGTFQAARSLAKEQKKFLLVNINKTDEFDSHRLNRDVWKDETVHDFVKSSCVFWQQDHTVPESRTYAERYHVSSFPHISILDPRTSRQLWQKTGFLEAHELIMHVSDVTSKYSLEEGAQSLKPPVPEQQMKPLHELPEDEQLAAAIAASLDDSKAKDTSSVPTEGDRIDLNDSSEDEGGSSDVEEVTGKVHLDSRANTWSQEMKPSSEKLCATDDKIKDKQGEQQNKSGLEKATEPGEIIIAIPEEPSAGDKGATRIQFKLPDGKRLVRRFKKAEEVQTLYSFVKKQLADALSSSASEGNGVLSGEFDLLTVFPSQSLSNEKRMTLESKGLCNAQVVVKLLER